MLTNSQIEKITNTSEFTETDLNVSRICNLEFFTPTFEEENPDDETRRAVLYSMGYTSEPTTKLVIKKHIDYIFSRPINLRSDRWSKKVHAFYTSKEEETAIREIAHYCKSPDHCNSPAPLIYDLIEVSFSGNYRKILKSSNLGITFKEKDKATSQSCGDTLAEKTDSIEVKSFRSKGNNFVIFSEKSIEPIRIIDKVAIKTYARTRLGNTEIYTRSKRLTEN